MRVQIIAAHPDDTEFICGGSIASMTANGDEVAYVLVTSGERGLPPDAPNRHLREHEQLAAGEVLGVKSIQFMRVPDGHVVNTPALRMKLVEQIRRYRPDLVITHSPVYNLASVRYSHLDHLEVGKAVFASIFPEARNPTCYHNELADLEPWTVKRIWLCGVEGSNSAIDISNYFAKKLEAAAKHESQVRKIKDFSGYFTSWALDTAEQHRLPQGALAEEFHNIDIA